MLDALFLIALAAALAGAWHRCAPAWDRLHVDGWRTTINETWNYSSIPLALIANAAAAAALPLLGVAYNPALWILLDIAAICAMAASTRPFTIPDVAVVLLFMPAWPLYFRNEQWAIDIGTALVTLQLLISVPWPAVAIRVKTFARQCRDRINGFSRLAHA